MTIEHPNAILLKRFYEAFAARDGDSMAIAYAPDATFGDGKILRHVDRFSFWRWAGMALGPTGKVLGWTPIIRNAVRKEARRGLQKFMASGR